MSLHIIIQLAVRTMLWTRRFVSQYMYNIHTHTHTHTHEMSDYYKTSAFQKSAIHWKSEITVLDILIARFPILNVKYILNYSVSLKTMMSHADTVPIRTIYLKYYYYRIMRTHPPGFLLFRPRHTVYSKRFPRTN